MLKILHGSIIAPKVGAVRDRAPDIRALKHWHLSVDSKEGEMSAGGFQRAFNNIARRLAAKFKDGQTPGH